MGFYGFKALKQFPLDFERKGMGVKRTTNLQHNFELIYFMADLIQQYIQNVIIYLYSIHLYEKNFLNLNTS